MKLRVFAIVIVSLFASATMAQQHGEVKSNHGRAPLIWNADQQRWQSIETFWLHYADSRGGLSWGRAANYPPYEKVKELDTLLVELDQGVCLMEFFHQRWRRANDVRRWDDAINEYGACPFVFDE